ncbi:hypothetical protein GH714_000235 [Hevea brasiliensis]|uniref:Serine-threonine/tyrosine-protein kinase catalytic domain-containing protein n=1 Tax=Hevea brasiliensis TaxID=3981 RepID=A0A6A6K978_HEVBR|nr:hypothetical protein GH714_000235 [Hevea brasiliensis]
MLAKQGQAHTMSAVAGSFGYIAQNTSLAEWAWRRNLEGKPIVDCLDEGIKESCYLDEMTTVFKLGLICTSTAPSTRPSMKDVLQILRRISPRNYGEKLGSEFDVTPLLGNPTYLSSYRRSNREYQMMNTILA